MMKRLLDLLVAILGLLLTSPILVPVIVLVWLQDFYSPFYIAPRVGKGGKQFRMIKLRSMVVNADKSGVDSTAGDDKRITKVGKFIRRYKLDELSQLWNVLIGDMSLVGPRPNVQRDVALYTDVEKKLLTVKPGITDFSSIVFADEGEILKGSSDPDLDYNRLIRPWKSRLGLLYVDKFNIFLDIALLFLTVTAVISRKWALCGVVGLLWCYNAETQLQEVAKRKSPLQPYPPPGALQVVASRIT